MTEKKLHYIVITLILALIIGASTAFHLLKNNNRTEESLPVLTVEKVEETTALEEIPTVSVSENPKPKSVIIPNTPQIIETPITYPRPTPCSKYTFTPTTPEDVSKQTLQYVENYREHIYPLYGHTREQIQEQISLCAPSTPDTNEQYVGIAWVQIDWWYVTKIENNLCLVDRYSILQTTDIAYPSWKQEQNNPREDDLLLRWGNFNTSMRIHEEGHRKHGYEVRDELIDLTDNFSSYSTCTELIDSLNGQGKLIIDTLEGRGITYDLVTNHGATQIIHPSIY